MKLGIGGKKDVCTHVPIMIHSPYDFIFISQITNVKFSVDCLKIYYPMVITKFINTSYKGLHDFSLAT